MAAPGLHLQVLPGTYSICRLAPGDAVPEWAASGEFQAAIRTGEELTLICAEESAPEEIRAERGFRALRVAGSLDFDLTGILASLTAPLAAAGVPIFALSTFDTDYLLVRTANFDSALDVLRSAGHRVSVSS